MRSICGDTRHYDNGGRADTDECRSEDQHYGERGQSTVLMSLFMATFLCGFVALGIDTQSLFKAKRMAQAAADAAAMAAAEEASNGTSSEQAAANAMAKLNGFDTTLATNPATVTLSVPSGGDYSGSSSYIQATVSKPISTFFMSVVNKKLTMTVAARARRPPRDKSSLPACVPGRHDRNRSQPEQ